MENKLQTTFLTYIEKVKAVIGNKKAQGAHVNPVHWLREQVEILEECPEFKELVLESSVTLGKKPIKQLEKTSPPTRHMQNFLRRSGCYLKIWEGDFVNGDDFLRRLRTFSEKKEVHTTTLKLLDGVSFPQELIDLGSFKIQKFSRAELDDLCQNEINRIFYPYAEWDTETLSLFWFIREEETTKKEKWDFNEETGFYISEDIVKNWNQVEREFPDQKESQLVIFNWNVREYLEGAGSFAEKEWMRFSIPIILKIDNALLETPSKVPKENTIIEKTNWVPQINQRTGEAIERPFQIYLEQDELEKLIKLVDKTQRFLAIRPEQWKFIDVAMGYIAKAFFATEYAEKLEQFLWHITALESLFSIKGEKIAKSLEKRLKIVRSKELSGKNFEKLYDINAIYDIRSTLVHGKTEFGQVELKSLWLARDLARMSVVWFINYLLDLHGKLESSGTVKENYPQREEILAVLDIDKDA